MLGDFEAMDMGGWDPYCYMEGVGKSISGGSLHFFDVLPFNHLVCIRSSVKLVMN